MLHVFLIYIDKQKIQKDLQSAHFFFLLDHVIVIDLSAFKKK